jgi:Carboxypeptidase regulatory-like domain/TonB dependent receptor
VRSCNDSPEGWTLKRKKSLITKDHRVSLLLATCLAACCCQYAPAQTTGRIAGTIKDLTGAVVASAEVTAASKSTAEQRQATSDNFGRYVLALLPPGAYRVSILAAGFKIQVFEEITVSITETTALDVNLTVGTAAGESVTVRSADPQLQADGPQLGRVVESSYLTELPLVARNFTQVLGLYAGTAGFLTDGTSVGRNTETLSVNGARVTQNNFQINGVDVNGMGTNAAVTVPTPAPETIQEFKVQTSLYDASYGRSGGGNIQVVTRSGSDEFHGAAYEYFRNDVLNANNPFLKAAGAKRPVLRRNVFGGTLGGPIRKNTAFFFVSYQGTRETNGASAVNSLSSNVLIAPGLTEDRSETSLLSTFTPKLPNGQPATAINPAALALLNATLPNGQFAIPTPQADGRYSGSTPSVFREDQFNSNVDWRVGQNDLLALKFFFANAPQTLTLPSFRGTGPNVPGFGNDQVNNNRVAAIQHVHIFRSKLLNESRAGYTFIRNNTFPKEPIKDSDVGIARSTAGQYPGLPLIRIAPAAGGVIIGTAATIDGRATPTVATFADTLSLNQGQHFLRVGAEIRYNQINFNVPNTVRGQIDFQDFNSFLTGNTLVSTLGNGISNRNLRATDYNFFAHDQWKVVSRLTLSLGLRYELDLPTYDTLGRISTFDPSLYQPRLEVGNKGNPVGPPMGGFVQAGNVIAPYDISTLPKVSRGLLNSNDWNNLAPRIGFAYSPRDSLVVRGGYGIYYSRPSFQYISISVPVPPSYVLGIQNGAPLADPFFAVPPQNQFPTFVSGIALAGTVPDRAIRTPYFQQYNASVQVALARDLLFEMAYVGTRGEHLLRQVSINQAQLASNQNPVTNIVNGATFTQNAPADAQLRAPLQGVAINGFNQNQSSAQSTYHSMQVNLTQRLSYGLQFLAAYTWAKSMDNASGQGGGAGIGSVLNLGTTGDTGPVLGNQLNSHANRGVSDFDRTHRFVLSSVWEIPRPAFTRDSTAGHLLLSDWQLSGVIVAMSGLPIDIVDTGAGSFYGLAGGSSPLARPNFAPGATCETATRNAPDGLFFNPLAFMRPVVVAGRAIPSSGGFAFASATGTDLGIVGRNCLRGPSQLNVDLALAKRFRLTESTSLEFRAELFNLFNNVNLSNPISNFNAISPSGGKIDPSSGQVLAPGDFGRIIATSNNARIVQFALSFNF